MSNHTDGRETAVIPTGYDPAAYTCVRSLSRQGVRTVIASEHDDVPAAASKFCDRSVTIPAPGDDLLAYKDALVELAADPAVRTVLPIRPYDPYVFARYAAEFEEHVSLYTPPMEMLDTVYDRVRLFEAAEEAGVPIPETRRLSRTHGWETDAIVKARYNLLIDRYSESHDAGEAETVKHVDHVRPTENLDHAAIRERMHHEPIVQEYVAGGEEYMFGGLYDHGEPVATFQHRQIRGNSYVGGGGVYRVSMFDRELESTARQLLEHLEWHGYACIEYVRDPVTGEYKLLEINPRLWQSLACAVRAGADFPYYNWLLATDRGGEITPEYRQNVGTHLLYGELGYLQSILSDESSFVDRPSLLGEALSIAASSLTMPRFDIFHVDDPQPFIRGIEHVLFRGKR